MSKTKHRIVSGSERRKRRHSGFENHTEIFNNCAGKDTRPPAAFKMYFQMFYIEVESTVVSNKGMKAEFSLYTRKCFCIFLSVKRTPVENVFSYTVTH